MAATAICPVSLVYPDPRFQFARPTSNLRHACDTPNHTLSLTLAQVINALLGDRYLEEGILPTTNEISVLKFAEDGVGSMEQNADGFFVRSRSPTHGCTTRIALGPSTLDVSMAGHAPGSRATCRESCWTGRPTTVVATFTPRQCLSMIEPHLPLALSRCGICQRSC